MDSLQSGCFLFVVAQANDFKSGKQIHFDSMGFAYPTEEEIIEYNTLALTIIKAKKSDSPKVLGKAKISDAIEACQKAEGDVYQKGAVLLKSLVCAHAFASGNRRTAFIAAKDFVLKNAGHFGVMDEPASAQVLLGIREGFYSLDEIKDWIQHGRIREFRRGQ